MTAITAAAPLNGSVATYRWQWQGHTINITYETLGSGQPILLLPALSTVSSRTELTALASQLATRYQITVLDWPGFGDSDRLRLAYQPALYQQFLKEFVNAKFSEPIAVVAAGHGAGYVLAMPDAWSRIVLVAPTWKGPLAVMGASATVRSRVRDLVRSHLVGPLLYWLNTRPAFLKWMYRRHVFVDDAQLTPEYIAQRHQITQKSGARYAPAAFVTGGLDPVETRDACLAYFDAVSVPVMVIVGEQAPPSSKAEMEVIAAQPGVHAVRLPGTLGMAEEFGVAVAETVLPFLQPA
ncbi:alpha/beta hydrolase [Leptolyngbya cf. ectocarpi LEGE 11479]|uniref:Alpha/beta hydrolase n=1 Tax=Leptolyngbya cf. ectocarpi LEGE 11479 TaxID=1828722 RepID=A0A928ZVY9_LEPEC|nr:alpha/beta hydrolase [Leptolyngbya ectocarpi]MBE9068492.1 alpha/beta hydrolase [Leptolyngbya cf. ectocarpi LEGE 11479]